MTIPQTQVKIGSCGVDSGCIWIGDPCYTSTREGHPGSFDDWNAFCKASRVPGSSPAQRLKSHQEYGLGVAIQTIYGDGVYNVYANLNEHGQVVSATIYFDNDPEDSEAT